MHKTQKSIQADLITKVLLISYLLILIWILLFKFGVQFSYMSERNINLSPFREFYTSAENVDPPQIILNILIFFPLGLYVGILFPKLHFFTKTALFFLVSFFIELFQYILKIGAFDITDIINNTLGGILGFLILKFLIIIFGTSSKAQKIVNWLGILGTALMLLLLVLLKLNMLPIQYQ